MKICFVVEGCYPYVTGGVSSWVQSMIKAFPEVEFVLQTIVSQRSKSGQFLYAIPENVTEIRETYLEDFDYIGKRKRRKGYVLPDWAYSGLSSLIMDQDMNIDSLLKLFEDPEISLNDLLMGGEFLEIVSEYYSTGYEHITFVDFLWTIRSMYLPLLQVFKQKAPKADIYHSVSTGYAGMIASIAKKNYGGRTIISEHGIYTREREEELVKAKWVAGTHKNAWISYFDKMARYTYNEADVVTSLFEDARKLQMEQGCPPEKAIVTPNGIIVSNFAHIKPKEAGDNFINVGAILRLAPIKDVKTMISAFALAKAANPRLKLWIMGPYDDEEYAQECMDLISILEVKDVVLTGNIRVTEYIGKMDLLILTSISEGQPLTILEGFAAKKPFIATNVGNCTGLIYGEDDDFGEAGIVVPVMAVSEIAEAIITIADNELLRKSMGEVGYKRLLKKYQFSTMKSSFAELYNSFNLSERQSGQ